MNPRRVITVCMEPSGTESNLPRIKQQRDEGNSELVIREDLWGCSPTLDRFYNDLYVESHLSEDRCTQVCSRDFLKLCFPSQQNVFLLTVCIQLFRSILFFSKPSPNYQEIRRLMFYSRLGPSRDSGSTPFRTWTARQALETGT